MFKCGLTGELSDPGESAVTIVVETRDREYPPRSARRDGARVQVDPGGVGTEIVRTVYARARNVLKHGLQGSVV